MADMQESIALLHVARNLIRRYQSGTNAPSYNESMAFLSDSESFIADGCGHKVQYDSDVPAQYKESAQGGNFADVSPEQRAAWAKRVIAELVVADLADLTLRPRQPYDDSDNGVMESDRDFLAYGHNMQAACKLLYVYLSQQPNVESI